MIDGISGRGGPLRGVTGPRVAAVETGAADPAQPLRRTAPADLATARSGSAALVAELAKAPPVNAARVAELRDRIAAGQFRIDPQAIADAMLRLDRGKP